MERIGSYRISRLIEEGGVAAVYLGVQESLERPVAVKVLQHRFSADTRVVDYFKRESLIIARLNHPNIIHVIDRGLTEDGRPFFVMEYIDGTNAARLIMEGALTFPKKLDILIQTCKALAYAHRNGVIHRDIKPANILVDREGHVHVADFGIARFYDGEGEGDRKSERLGTPSYMSPEQLKDSRAVSFESDIYSLGVVMAEMFSGRRFPKNHVLPSPLAPDVPESLERLVRQCLEPLPENRPASAELIMNRLLMLSQGDHIGEARKKKAMGSAPAMEEIFVILDIIRESEQGALYLLRHRESDRLLVARTFGNISRGVQVARLLMNLRHEGIVAVQGVAGNSSGHIVVMEYLACGSLADRMVMPLDVREALRILGSVVQALRFAHANRVTHGNLTPSNVLFTETDAVKITDFGMNDFEQGVEKDIGLRMQEDVLACGTLFYTMVLGFSPVVEDGHLSPHKPFKNLPRDVRHLIDRFFTTRQGIRFTAMSQVVTVLDEMQGNRPQDDLTVITPDSRLASLFKSAGSLVTGSRPPPRAVFAAGIVLLVLILGGLTLLLYSKLS